MVIELKFGDDLYIYRDNSEYLFYKKPTSEHLKNTIFNCCKDHSLILLLIFHLNRSLLKNNYSTKKSYLPYQVVLKDLSKWWCYNVIKDEHLRIAIFVR